jgi:hypothetical protein
MIKGTGFILLIASSLALGQRLDTPAAVRRSLSSGQTSPQAQPVAATSTVAPDAANAESDAAVPVEVMNSHVSSAGKRDPFLSPVTTGHSLPSAACAAGKRCLMIDQILLRGVVKTATGMIAVVANSANKAYFLRENDPVFNGYVVRITADSIVF